MRAFALVAIRSSTDQLKGHSSTGKASCSRLSPRPANDGTGRPRGDGPFCLVRGAAYARLPLRPVMKPQMTRTTSAPRMAMIQLWMLKKPS